MRVLLLADDGGLADEGARNISKAIVKGMKQYCDVLSMPAPAASQRLIEIRQFSPDIIHSIHGPSIRTFVLMAVLHWLVPDAACFASLSQTPPTFNHFQPFFRLFRFVRLLSQDSFSESIFANLGFSVQPLPNGVDTQHFRPTKPVLPRSLQAVLPLNKPILMHVGHLKPNRGLNLLAHLNGYCGWQMLIVGSLSMTADPEVVSVLEDLGCFVLREYIDDLPGLYCAAKAYVFPVSHPLGAIDMPLSVLEAMACNRPVISTRYKALPRFLPQGNGLFYFDTIDEAKKQLDQIMEIKDVSTRDKVAPFAWKNIHQHLYEIYYSCLHT